MTTVVKSPVGGRAGPACGPSRGVRSSHTAWCSVVHQRSQLETADRDALASNTLGRREALGLAVTALVTPLILAQEANAITSNPLAFKKEVDLRRRKIPESEFSDGPDGLKYYDLTVGDGATAVKGDRVAVHYDIKWRGITFMTSRQGMGVTGGTPLGFDVGTTAGEPGSTLPGLDLAVQGMRVGGLRRVLVPPNLAYGDVQVGEIPPGSTLALDVELLSIKTNPLGFRTKLIEG